MKNDENGMTLIEAVAALSILSLFCLAFLPVYTAYMAEQHSVNEERTALYLLEREGLRTKYHVSDAGEKEEEGIYTWSKHKKDGGIDICLSWEGANRRKYEKCLYVLPK